MGYLRDSTTVTTAIEIVAGLINITTTYCQVRVTVTVSVLYAYYVQITSPLPMRVRGCVFVTIAWVMGVTQHWPTMGNSAAALMTRAAACQSHVQPASLLPTFGKLFVYFVTQIFFVTVTEKKNFTRNNYIICIFHPTFLRGGAKAPQWARASSFTRLLDCTRRRTTAGRTPLDE
jgi:hypothetical protein